MPIVSILLQFWISRWKNDLSKVIIVHFNIRRAGYGKNTTCSSPRPIDSCNLLYEGTSKGECTPSKISLKPMMRNMTTRLERRCRRMPMLLRQNVGTFFVKFVRLRGIFLNGRKATWQRSCRSILIIVYSSLASPCA